MVAPGRSIPEGYHNVVKNSSKNCVFFRGKRGFNRLFRIKNQWCCVYGQSPGSPASYYIKSDN
jgi:hypothetical protein